MIAAEMVNHCGIDSWTRNSRIVYATSASPGGLYERQAQIEGYSAPLQRAVSRVLVSTMRHYVSLMPSSWGLVVVSQC